MTGNRAIDSYLAVQRALLSDRFRALIPQGPVALLDFPDHRNVGDSAIWCGERRLLAANGNTVSYAESIRRNRFSSHALRTSMPHGTILLHGGGNLGSVWPAHNELRRRVLAELRDYRVVQLPQTAHCASPADADDLGSMFAGHPDVHVMVRDKRSLQLMEDLSVRAYLTPDAAFGLTDRSQTGATRQVGWLVRRDKESVEIRPADGDSVFDWHDVVPARSLTRLRLSHHTIGLRAAALQRVPGPLLPVLTRHRLSSFDQHAERVVELGTRHLASFATVVTNRLHGAILALLSGRRVIALETTYGKVHDYFVAFPPEAMFTEATNVAEAEALAGS